MTRPTPKPRSVEAHPLVADTLLSRIVGWIGLGSVEQDSLVNEAVSGMLACGYWQIPAERLADGVEDLVGDDTCNLYLDGAGVGKVLGVDRKTALSYRLPPADATVGEWRGWHTSTIIRWNHERPRMTTGVDVTIREALRREVAEYETKHNMTLPIAMWLHLRERAIEREAQKAR